MGPPRIVVESLTSDPELENSIDPQETLARSKPTTAALFDHLVGNGEESGRESEAERLGGFQVYDQLD